MTIDWEKIDRFIETYAGIVSKERAEEAYEREDWAGEYVRAADYDAAVRELRVTQRALEMAIEEDKYVAPSYRKTRANKLIEAARSEMKETRESDE